MAERSALDAASHGLTQLCEASLLGIVQLGALDDDRVGRQVDTPSQCSCAAEDLDQSIPKQALDQIPVRPQHASVVDARASFEQLLHLPVEAACLSIVGAQNNIFQAGRLSEIAHAPPCKQTAHNLGTEIRRATCLERELCAVWKPPCPLPAEENLSY